MERVKQAKDHKADPFDDPDVKKMSRKIAFVEDREMLENAARDLADARMAESKKELKGLTGYWKKFWRHNVAAGYYRQKEIVKAREEIMTSGNVYVGEGGKDSEHEAEMDSIVKRFTSEYDEMIHKEAGETKDVFGKTEEEQKVKSEVEDVVREYAKGNISDTGFEDERNRIFSKVTGVPEEEVESRIGYMDNLLSIAKEAKGLVDHGTAIRDLDLDLEIVVGKAKSGVRTEAQYNAVDRITSNVMKSPVGRFVNETTVAGVIAGAQALAVSVARSRAVAWFTFGAGIVASGGIAGAKESARVEQDRRQHFREMAQGKQFNPREAMRRKEMEKFRYDTVGANDLIGALEDSLYEHNGKGERNEKVLDAPKYEKAVANLAEIEARIKLSDMSNASKSTKGKIDMIHYSDITNVEKERLNLDKARAIAKVALGKSFDGVKDKLTNFGGENFDSLISDTVKERMKVLTEGDKGVEKKNELFGKMKKKRVGKAILVWCSFCCSCWNCNL